MDQQTGSWRCKLCGDDSGRTALLAKVDEYLTQAGFRVPSSKSLADYCPECFWEKVTKKEPTPDVLPTMLEKRGYGVNKVPPGKYGPYDDTSPGDENATRASEGD